MTESVTDILAQEMRSRAEAARNNAAGAKRTSTLALDAVKEYPQGSPWIIIESAILDAARNVYATETANAVTFEAAARAIEDQA